MERIDLTDHGVIISHEDAHDSQKYARAKAIAAEKHQTLHVAPPVAPTWQPPADALAVPHDVTPEEYRAAREQADALGLASGVVVAPQGWRGAPVHTQHGGEWTPPPNSIVVPSNVTFAEWERASEAAKRLRCQVVIAPEGVPMPEKLPQQLTAGLPVVIPADASPAEYRRLKKLAEERRVPYGIGAK